MALKKWTALLLAALLALGLTACQNEKRIEGLVVEVRTDEAGDPTAFVLEDHGGERTGVLLAEGSRFWPRESGTWTDEELRAVLREELRVDAWVGAWCYPRKEKLETAEGEMVRAHWATSVQVEGELRREAVTLRDGTAIDSLEYDGWESHTYRLADGTEILRVDEPFGPENVQVMGQEGFESLSEAVQEKVRACYEDRGPLYNEAEELERCYAAWKELGEAFQAGHIRQETSPAAASERVMYFTTELTRPGEYGTNLCRMISLQDAFDRRTGEKLITWDLFAAPEEEVRRRLPELVDWDIPRNVRTAMTEVLEPEWIHFSRDELSIRFPAGSLPGEEWDYIISVDYENAPEGFLQPWAVPVSEDE